jgi:hypothetical protein
VLPAFRTNFTIRKVFFVIWKILDKPAGAVKTRKATGHNRIFQIVMYTTAWLRYAGRQFVAHVT